jgi:prophage tail gpP-like protein
MTDPLLTVKFTRLGRETTRLGSWWIDSDYLTSTDGFEFIYHEPDRALTRGLILEPVELSLSAPRVSNALQVIGRVDITEIGSHGPSVRCDGRDYIADLVECGVDPTIKVNANSTVDSVVAQAMAPCGIDTIIGTGDLLLRNARTGRVAGNAGAAPDFAAVKLEELKPQAGQGIYDFCSRLVARNGATIQPATTRSAISLSVPDYGQTPLYSIRCSDSWPSGSSNNLLSATAREDASSFPTYMLATGSAPSTQSGSKLQREYRIETVAAALGGDIEARLAGKIATGRIKNLDGAPRDGRLYRFLYHADGEAKNSAQVERVSTRRFSELFKDLLLYTATLQGISDPESGAIYAPNTTISVRDEVRGIDEVLWVMGCRLSFDPEAGATTELRCIRKGSLQL